MGSVERKVRPPCFRATLRDPTMTTLQAEHRQRVEGIGSAEFAVSAGIVAGLALGAILDALVFCHLLQWHHVAPGTPHPLVALVDLEIKTVWDGLFHTSTFMLGVGLILSWRQERWAWLWESRRLLAASCLMGLGLFNLVEGLINHHLLGVHHFNVNAASYQSFFWDAGYLAWGVVMLSMGAQVLRATPDSAAGSGARR